MSEETPFFITHNHPKLEKKNIVLLVQLGTPKQARFFSIARFLHAFLRDPYVISLNPVLWWPILYGFILPFRPWRLIKAYRSIYSAKNGMPIHHYTKILINALNKKKLSDSKHSDITFYGAMRYGDQSIKAVLHSLQSSSVECLMILPLFPQYSYSTTASIFNACSQSLRKWPNLPNIKMVKGYWDHPLYIRAIARSIESFWSTHNRSERLLIAFHGLPEASLQFGDPYYCLCHKTMRLIREALSLKEDEVMLVFQSRFGYQSWLKPYCNETLKALAFDGVQSVDVVSPGFSMDCLETLEELNQTYRQLFLSCGGKQYHYIPALNALDQSVDFYHALVDDLRQSC